MRKRTQTNEEIRVERISSRMPALSFDDEVPIFFAIILKQFYKINKFLKVKEEGANRFIHLLILIFIQFPDKLYFYSLQTLVHSWDKSYAPMHRVRVQNIAKDRSTTIAVRKLFERGMEAWNSNAPDKCGLRFQISKAAMIQPRRSCVREESEPVSRMDKEKERRKEKGKSCFLKKEKKRRKREEIERRKKMEEEGEKLRGKSAARRFSQRMM